MRTVTDRVEGPAWLTAGATAAGYLLVLAVLFVLLFAVPYAVVTA